MMHTTISYSFKARPYYPEEDIGSPSLPVTIEACPTGPWLTSAGRWGSHAEAVNAATDWLKSQLDITPQQYEIALIQVEELDLING
jgi:hypothetical protein